MGNRQRVDMVRRDPLPAVVARARKGGGLRIGQRRHLKIGHTGRGRIGVEAARPMPLAPIIAPDEPRQAADRQEYTSKIT